MSTNKVFVSLLATGLLAACGGSDAPSEAESIRRKALRQPLLRLILAAL